jgi:hypothetical protein
MKFEALPYLQSCWIDAQASRIEVRDVFGWRRVSGTRKDCGREEGGLVDGEVDGIVYIILSWVHE